MTLAIRRQVKFNLRCGLEAKTKIASSVSFARNSVVKNAEKKAICVLPHGFPHKRDTAQSTQN